MPVSRRGRGNEQCFEAQWKFQIRVELAGDSSWVRLRISDSGRGFESGAMENTEGLGLLSMREPLRLVGGELSIQSRPNGGTQVEARIPFFLWAANIIQ